MFKDYYELLGITENASQEEIKKGFRDQAVKWHPDRNKGVDTTSRMQEINEAYLILKDPDARIRYDREYQRFKSHIKQEKTHEGFSGKETQNEQKGQRPTHQYTDFKVEDDILEKWMFNAKKQAVDLAQQTIKDFKGVSVAASQGFVTGIKQVIVWVIVINLIVFSIKACNG